MTINSLQSADEAVLAITSIRPDVGGWGTAFVFHSDSEYTYLLTCAHVIGEVGGCGYIQVGDRPASVIALGEDALDIAVLRVDGQLNGPSLSLSSMAHSRSPFRLVGITKLTTSLFESRPISGTLGKAVTLLSRGQLRGHKAWELIMDSACTLQSGHSGSPVLNEDGKCVAIAVMRKGQGESGIAISIDVLRSVWPNRPGNILPDEMARPLRERSAANLYDEIDAFEKIVSRLDTLTRFISIYADGGMGKTMLMREYEEIASHYEIKTVSYTLNQQLSVEDFLTSLAATIGFEYFESFRDYLHAEHGERLTEHFRLLNVHFFDDIIKKVDQEYRLIVLIDKYDVADKLFKEGFGGYFLPWIGRVRQLLLVVAGRELVAPHISAGWVKRFELQKPPPECWVEYCNKCGLRVPLEIIVALHRHCEGLPYNIATILQAYPVICA